MKAADVEAEGLIILLIIIPVNQNDVEVLNVVVALFLGHVGNWRGETSALYELDDISRDLLWKLNRGAIDHGLLLGA